MKFRKTKLSFLFCSVILSFTSNVLTQPLPPIIWNKAASGTEEPVNHAAVTYSIKFSPDGQRVFSGGNRKYGSPETARITIFNAADGAFIRTTQVSFPIPSINELDVSNDGQRIYTAHNWASCDILQTNCIYSYILYDAPTLTRISEPETTFYSSSSVDISPNNQLVAVGDLSPENNIRLLNPSDISLLRTLPGHTIRPGDGRTFSVRFSPDSQLLASSGGDGKVKIWRVADGALLRTFDMQTMTLRVASVAFSPDGQYLAAADNDTVSEVKIWRVSDGALVRTLTNPYFFSIPRHEVTWTPDGRYVVTNFTTGNDPSFIRFWDFATGELAREYRSGGVEEAIRSLDFSPDGRTLAFDLGLRVVLARNPFAPRTTFADFDGDRRSDPAIFREGMWYMQESAGGFAGVPFGLPTDRLAPADYDGDGKTDPAVFRDGTWYWLGSSNGGFNAMPFGAAGDVPVPADFTGDGRAEAAVYRGGVWWTYDLTSSQSGALQFGIATDKTVPADFDGDGKADYAVFREGVWHYLKSSDGSYQVVQFGLAADLPAVGDYDGDGSSDPAVYRGGTWYVLGSRQGFYAFQFGLQNDVPVAADYDGDGKTDAAVSRDGVWYTLASQAGLKIFQFGVAGDRPVQAAFSP